jgi:hypothetical protein
MALHVSGHPQKRRRSGPVRSAAPQTPVRRPASRFASAPGRSLFMIQSTLCNRSLSMFGTVRSGAYIARCARARASGRNRWFEMTWRNFTLICAHSANCHRTSAPFFALAASLPQWEWNMTYKKRLGAGKNVFISKCAWQMIYVYIFYDFALIGLWLFFSAQSVPNQW